MTDNPKVSVLMPVFNGERYLPESIESILLQTYSDFEFNIINDGSTDRSLSIINDYAAKDSRIRVIDLSKNHGLVYCLNLGIKESRGDLIARMDADDISHADRLAKQVFFMFENPLVAVCGTCYQIVEDDRILKPPAEFEAIKLFSLKGSPIAHPTAILNMALLKSKKLDCYDPEFFPAEDYEYWLRISRFFQIRNLDEVLVRIRKHDSSVSSNLAQIQRDTADLVRSKQWEFIIGRNISIFEFKILDNVIRVNPPSEEYSKTSENLLMEVLDANTFIDGARLRALVLNYWNQQICRRNSFLRRFYCLFCSSIFWGVLSFREKGRVMLRGRV